MSPEAQGRFCASCCKTVVDFTGMSDAELLRYFSSPKEQVCGRFYSDQLNRPVQPVKPASRVPNLLFRYSWPAFVLFLKSCTDPGSQGRTLGKIAVSDERFSPSPDLGLTRASYLDTLKLEAVPPLFQCLRFEDIRSFQTLGFVSPMMMTDTTAVVSEPAKGQPEEVVTIVSDTILAEEVACPVQEDTTAKAMDTVTVTAYPSRLMGKVVTMGAVATVKAETISQPVAPVLPSLPNPESMLVFPNPAPAGGLITISLEEEGGMPRQVELFNIQGARVLSVQQSEGVEATVFNLRIPAQLAAGTYILRLSHPQWKAVVSRKIIIQ